MRARVALAVILTAFAAASAIAALITIRQVKMETAERHLLHLRGPHLHPTLAGLGCDGHEPVQLARRLAAPLSDKRA
jgi:hypothetical protein